MIRRQLAGGALVLCVLGVTGCQDRGGSTVRAIAVTERNGERSAGVEYVSGVVTLHEGDTITVHVLNYSPREQFCEIEVYRDTRAGAKLVSENEGYTIKPRGIASCRYAVKTTGEYWVLIKGERPPLAPEAIFGGNKAGNKPAEDASLSRVFKPGDFLKVEAPAFPAYGRGTEREIRTTEKVTRPIKETKKE